ncbi:MAG: SpoIIE family protein phosphatase [Planctomycetota bacterium]|jgi:phosphoserine phosphatase|nr:SpoIIE family protein phosphatase [Planctomycetota bacterium]
MDTRRLKRLISRILTPPESDKDPRDVESQQDQSAKEILDNHSQIDRNSLWRILEVTRQLGAPCDLRTMLGRVIDLAREVLDAERGSVFLYDEETDELFTFVASGIDELRLPADQGIVGTCAQSMEMVNVEDCYADERFNQEVDRKTGFRTRCLLSVPLVGIEGDLVGVLQLLNKVGGIFEKDDERIATVLAAQCAVALQRTRWMEDYVVRQRQEQDLLIAREIQQDVLPGSMPTLEHYELTGWNRPADEAGGDIFDAVALNEHQVLLLVGDASGHGIGPALSVTQVRSMLRVCLRLEAPLDSIISHVNNQLSEDLAAGRFVTAFFGLIDNRTHEVMYQSTGQGPIYFYRKATNEWIRMGPTTVPLGLMNNIRLAPPATFSFEPGDLLLVISDGIFEHPCETDEQFGEERVKSMVVEKQEHSVTEISEILVETVDQFAGKTPQADDMTIVMVRRTD